jgi:hypothetical protein
MDDLFRRSHDSGLFHPARSWLLERRIMLRNYTRDLRSAQFGSLLLVALLVAAFAAPAHASVVSNLSQGPQTPAEHQFRISVTPQDPSEETIRVPIWIPGFDDVEPSLNCSQALMPNLSVKPSSNLGRYLVDFAGMRRFGQLSVVDSCRGILRTLPWNSPPAPIGPIQVLLPMV